MVAAQPICEMRTNCVKHRTFAAGVPSEHRHGRERLLEHSQGRVDSCEQCLRRCAWSAVSIFGMYRVHMRVRRILDTPNVLQEPNPDDPLN
eukprot:SAG31_NODE_15052_length_773_cov_0.983680_1_plen_90_part_10